MLSHLVIFRFGSLDRNLFLKPLKGLIMSLFYEENKVYLEKYWDRERNTLSLYDLEGNEEGVFWFRCVKCGAEWSVNSLVLIPFLGKYKHGGKELEKKTATGFVKLKKLWDYSVSQGKPEDYARTSGKKVALRCTKCGGKWTDYDVADVC